MSKFHEKRAPFLAEQAKFGTQEKVSYAVILIIAAVIANLVWRGGIADIKEVYNTLLPFFGLVLGFWIGSSKGAAENRDQLNKLMPTGFTADALAANTTETVANTTALEQNTEQRDDTKP